MSDDRLSRMKTAMMRMVVGVLLVDAVGIALYYLTPLTHSGNGRITLALFWVLAILAVLVPSMRALREARRN
ncbi:MAG: hypothetical protein ABIZ70_05760 [Gemmatimonadales bacterium]